MRHVVWLFLIGGVATLARFGAIEGMKKLFPAEYMPWGTWLVNILGCFLFGLIWVLAEERGLVSASFRLYALVGFMGTFTTFSTYAFESVLLYRDVGLGAGLVNILGQNIIGLAALAAGMAVARLAGE